MNSLPSNIHHNNYLKTKQYECLTIKQVQVTYMVLIKDEWLLPLGGIFLAIAILVERFLLVDVPILDFLIGVFTGMSLVLNLVGLIKINRKAAS